MGQISPQLALKVLLQFDKAINNALSTRAKNRISFKVSIVSARQLQMKYPVCLFSAFA